MGTERQNPGPSRHRLSRRRCASVAAGTAPFLFVALVAVSCGGDATGPEPTPEDEAPALSGRIAFASDGNGNSGIHVLDLDAGSIVQLTEDSDGNPTWSPDGTRIAFHRGVGDDVQIWTMNADGSNQAQLTTIPVPHRLPAWSDTPTGERIAFQSNRFDNSIGANNKDIYWISPDVSSSGRFTTHEALDTDPAWSPDGSEIAFTSFRDPGGVYVMDVNGGNFRHLTSDARQPGWSPDGTKIAFSTDRDFADLNTEIYIMDADGSNPVRLTNSPAKDLAPAWSPDGANIAFMSNRDGSFDIWAMDADGSNPVRLTDDPGIERSPAWIR